MAISDRFRHKASLRCPLCKTKHYWGVFCDQCDELLVKTQPCADCGRDLWPDEAVNWDGYFSRGELPEEYEGKLYCDRCRRRCPECLEYVRADEDCPNCNCDECA